MEEDGPELSKQQLAEMTKALHALKGVPGMEQECKSLQDKIDRAGALKPELGAKALNLAYQQAVKRRGSCGKRVQDLQKSLEEMREQQRVLEREVAAAEASHQGSRGPGDGCSPSGPTATGGCSCGGVQASPRSGPGPRQGQARGPLHSRHARGEEAGAWPTGQVPVRPEPGVHRVRKTSDGSRPCQGQQREGRCGLRGAPCRKEVWGGQGQEQEQRQGALLGGHRCCHAGSRPRPARWWAPPPAVRFLLIASTLILPHNTAWLLLAFFIVAVRFGTFVLASFAHAARWLAARGSCAAGGAQLPGRDWEGGGAGGLCPPKPKV